MAPRLLALDIGKQRSGIAISDATKTIAQPYSVFATSELSEKNGRFSRLLLDWEVKELVVGLPMLEKGKEGAQVRFTKQVAERLAATFDLSLHYVDERHSSSEAKRIMREAGLSEREMRGKLDAVAASLILEVYLEREGGQHARDLTP